MHRPAGWNGAQLNEYAHSAPLARQIPSARLVELPGPDHLLFAGDNSDEITRAIVDFIEAPAKREKTNRVLATIVLIQYGDGVGDRVSDAVAASVSDELRRFRATHVAAQDGAGIAATFDGPARALECARSLSLLLSAAGIHHRIGVHAGEA